MKNIIVNNPCKIEKFELDSNYRKNKKTNEVIEGSFIKIYKHFLLFRTKQGHRECFTKRTYDIDWRILGNKQYRQVTK